MSIAAAAIALVGALWSQMAERPAGTKTLCSYLFSSGPGDSGAERQGIVVADGAEPSDGWWLASDGRWYPPESGPETRSPDAE